MIRYGKTINDERGCVHSIDNLIVEYAVSTFRAQTVLDELSQIFLETIPGWERSKNCREDLPACSKYQYFRSTIWGGGFHISYGHYKDFDKLTREWSVYPLLRVKFNPNKWISSPVFPRLVKWIEEWCDNGVIVKFDYAVDVPCLLSDITVHSRKEPGLFKGTRYYGQRNQHGRLKIYDKKAESELPDDTSRVEWTFCLGREIVFDDVLWLTRGPEPLPDVGVLSSQLMATCRILLDLRACGGDVEHALGYLDRRTRKKIEPYTVGTGVQLFDSGVAVLVVLLRYYCSLLSVSFSARGVNSISIGSDSDRMSLDDLEDDDVLPF